jgi:hypothetical protein
MDGLFCAIFRIKHLVALTPRNVCMCSQPDEASAKLKKGRTFFLSWKDQSTYVCMYATLHFMYLFCVFMFMFFMFM